MRVISIAIFCLLASLSYGQKAVSGEIANHLASGQTFHSFSPLAFVTEDVQDRAYQLDGLTRGTILRLDEQAIADLRNNEHQFIRFSLPSDSRHQLNLQLVRQEIFAEDFSLYTSDQPGIPVAYTPGIHYKGMIEGQPSSVVALSIFDNEIMGLISTPQGNLVLGRMDQDRESRHILYHEADLTRKSAFSCETADDGFGYTEEDLKPQPAGRDAGDCVRVYIEIDDDIVTQKGGAAPATNYITGLFNQSITLYANESVNMTISEIYAWTTNSPYSGSNSSQMLTSFQNNSGDFNGNIGHLVSYQASGGIAVLDNLCSTNPDWRKCFSSIDASYQNVPTYSWSVMVITHEMGHVIGSKHTHACAWNGNNTAIDGCAGSTEGGCPLPPIPEGGGTIMSYCHLTGEGINFNLGFGPQPGNVIRNRVNAAGNCLTSCGPPPPPPPPQYCSSNGSNSSYEWIQKVVLGSISNTSGNNGGYFDYTALSANLTAGTTYTIQLTPGFAGQSYLEYWRVWIDYNGDLDWADAGEQVAQGTGSAMINLNFTVPTGTPSGNKRMRVSMKYSGYPSSCGTFTYGEVEDYTVIVGGGSGPSCSDGIQNQGETGIDCGGPCPACPTCSDGIQNQGETGVDCGGPCPACPPPPPGGEVTLLASYFETGWDSWVDGGVDATRVNSTNSWEGSYSIRLADNSTTQSAMTSPGFNLSDATGFEIEFYFKAVGVETGEDFWVRYKNGSNAWVTVGQIIKGTHFENNVFYVATVNVPGFVPTSNGKFRIQCDASDDSDQVYIDQVTIKKLTGTPLVRESVTIKPVAGSKEHPVIVDNLDTPPSSLLVFPNPVHDVLHIGFEGPIENMKLLSLDGQVISLREQRTDSRELDIQHLAPGFYFLWVQSQGQWHPAKFSKM